MSSETLDKAKAAMLQARIGFMAIPSNAFFTSLMFAMDFKWEEDKAKCPTAQTNGKRIWFNPEFFMSISHEVRIFVIFHEIMHPVLLHFLRLEGRNPDKWNRAGDYVINLMAKNQGLTLWDKCLYDPKYAGKTTEEIYNLLPVAPMPDFLKDIMPATGDGEGGEGDQSMTPEEVADFKEFMQEAVVRAAQQSKMKGDKPGTIPGEIEVFLDRLLKPKLPFATILRRHMKALDKTDYSMRRPNRRYMPKFYLPTLRGEAMADLTFYVDISGSTSDADFHRFVSEAAGVLKNLKPKKLTLVAFDTRIVSEQTASNLSDMERFKFHGRGGTYITPVFKHIAATRPEAAIIFTDGYFHMPEEQPDVPMYWCIVNQPGWKAPKGVTIHYET